jgi:hypothetical protein
VAYWKLVERVFLFRIRPCRLHEGPGIYPRPRQRAHAEERRIRLGVSLSLSAGFSFARRGGVASSWKIATRVAIVTAQISAMNQSLAQAQAHLEHEA